MTTVDHFTESPSFESPVRNAADIIAFAVHNLGYWPHDSIVLVTASEHHMGPTVRANAGNLGVQEAADLMTELLQMMPSELDAAERIEKFFIIQFGQGGDLRNRQLNPATFCTPTLAEIEADAVAVSQSKNWIEAGMIAAEALQLRFVDLFYIGEVSRWELSSEENAIEFSGFITDVQQSSLYVELVTRGSVVVPSESEGLDLKIPDTGATMHTTATQLWNAQTQFWIEHFRTTLASGETEYCANYLKQKYVENILWNAVIEADLDSRRHRFSDEQRLNAQALRADGLREIIAPPLAGFLVATLSSSTSAQFVLLNIARNLTELEHLMYDLRLESAGWNQRVEPAAVLLPLDVGENPTVVHALEQAVRFDDVFGVPAESASSGADVFAQLLMGHSSIGPCWERVDSLELLISLFANLVEGEQLAHLLLMRSWISWFKGESSLASAAMLQAQEAGLAGGVPLEILLERSIIPEWVSHSDQCYKSRKLG